MQDEVAITFDKNVNKQRVVNLPFYKANMV